MHDRSPVFKKIRIQAYSAQRECAFPSLLSLFSFGADITGPAQ
jgi:hypothetical protein